MNFFEKIGVLTVFTGLLVGVIFMAYILFMAIGGGMIALVQTQKPKTDVGPIVHKVENNERIKLDDPDLANAVCLFVIMRKYGGTMKKDLWDKRMETCVKEIN